VALTPVEIRHIRLGRGFRGYKREPADELLAEIAASFEDVWRERADLSDKVEQLEEDLVRYRELEALLRQTMISAERAGAENERLVADSRRVRVQLQMALATIDEAEDEDAPAETWDETAEAA
jgi:cell division septum initiation protein DivIVA